MTKILVRQNVVFTKESEIHVTRSTWTVTLDLDLKPYETLLNKYLTDITKVAVVNWDTIKTIKKDLEPQFTQHFIDLEDELRHLNDTRRKLVDTFDDYRSLHQRSRRSILPFVGDALSWLFGTTSESDMNNIRVALKTLNSNQGKLQHVVKQSLSMVNMTHNQVIQNRKRLNKLNEGMREIYTALRNYSKQTNSEIEDLKVFLNFYIQLQTVVANSREMMMEILAYMEDLKMQVNMLSIGKLSPNTILPSKLLDILNEVKMKLPHSLNLPLNPMKRLWDYYKILLCSTVFEEDKILIVLKIPMINNDNKLTVYKVHNLLVPHYEVNSNQLPRKLNGKHLVAQYKLEGKAIALNKQRTKYMLLNSKESRECTKTNTNFCKLSSPMYPINAHKYCVIALLTNNKQKIKELCKTKVKLNERLPAAKSVLPGTWAISSKIALIFTITCDKGEKVKSVKIAPPVDMLYVNPGCLAHNEYFTLPSYSEFESNSKININPDFRELRSRFKNQTFGLWKPLTKSNMTFNKDWNVESLKDIKELDMKELVDKINEINPIDIDESDRKWNWWEIMISVGLAVITVVLIVRRLCTGKLCNWSCCVERAKTGDETPTAIELEPLREAEKERVQSQKDPLSGIYPRFDEQGQFETSS